MKIAIFSDIHENLHNLIRALEISRTQNAEQIICLGDFINPGVAHMLATCGLPTHAIWGNNDGDQVLITKIAMHPKSGLTISDKTYDFLERDGRQLFLTHYDALARPMAKSGEYDAVFYGHNHQKQHGREGNCLLLNPGELSGHITGNVSFALYDTATNDAQLIDITENIVILRTPLMARYFGNG